MDRYTIIYDDRMIQKNGVFYTDLDLSWLPSDVLAVQVFEDGTADIEKGDRVRLNVNENEDVADVTTLSWWSNVDPTWSTAHTIARSSHLSSLSFSTGTLSPTFNSDQTHSYTLNLSNSESSYNVTAVTEHSDATMTMSTDVTSLGDAVTSGSAFSVSNVEVGSTTLTVYVTGVADGIFSQYEVLVERASE